ncbi:hypothetical protein GPECTOR_65g181 [Gonium pectorale]|uniref:G-patch domain-containing protein n=1 Tax=Gonium pectorale TaxID=33097 RepID=A0A150G461_GONPE|nr:hypothetical protein GPECTOR_65g181 [Gonium pectorale]|eukprot:KXZ44563.1 hypothetical protein GPECTOR_65g181 [Gonium pectorale]
MGYQDGSGLGAGRAGRAEPLPLDLKSGRAGLGVDEQRRRERQAREEQEAQERAKRARLAAETQERFKAAAASGYGARQAVRHLRGAWRVAEELEERRGQPAGLTEAAGEPRSGMSGDAMLEEERKVEEERAARARGELAGQARPRREEGPVGLDAGAGPAEEGPTAAAATGAPAAPEQLELLLLYMRRRYCYCYFCGCQYDSASDLEASCPGLGEDEH